MHPQADDPQERWLQLAHKAVRYTLCLRASEFASTAQRFHERRRVARRAPASVSDHQDLLSFVSVLPVAPGGTWEPGCSGRLLAIFWHKNPPEITRFPWSRPAALVVACGRASCAGSLGTQLAQSCAGANTSTAFKRTTFIAAPVHALTLHSLLRRCIHTGTAFKRVRVSVVRMPAPPVLWRR